MERIARGNVTEVKIVLASVALALGVYQLLLIAVDYRKLRLSFLAPRPAGAAHRAAGDAIVVVLVVVGVMCVSYFGVEGDAVLHSVVSSALFAVLGVKILVLRRWRSAGRFLPPLGLTVFTLLVAAWLTSAGSFLAGG